ncbi:hypothetical protein [Pedobacter sp. BMA]|uniref:hypothetical protein n=1 Tax=Pedobacter sp. BMA TaxID=1663685 RepID=UPI0006499980|nr:hypothetical protein [Pedobacter sp. BMA]KLT67399.1 hypothetical protein AB669_01460 [Pedobacter sp. BMA]
MSLSNSNHKPGDRVINPLNVSEINPIIFYSGKEDELMVELVGVKVGELIIKSLSTDVLLVKALKIADEDICLAWKQTEMGLRITLPELVTGEAERKKCRLIIRF